MVIMAHHHPLSLRIYFTNNYICNIFNLISIYVRLLLWFLLNWKVNACCIHSRVKFIVNDRFVLNSILTVCQVNWETGVWILTDQVPTQTWLAVSLWNDFWELAFLHLCKKWVSGKGARRGWSYWFMEIIQSNSNHTIQAGLLYQLIITKSESLEDVCSLNTI